MAYFWIKMLFLIMRKIILSLLLAFSFQFSIAQDSVYESVVSSLRLGDSKQLSIYFNSNMELTILDNESVYSKIQAELVLKEFFEKYPVSSYSLLHRGKSPEGSIFSIGKLTTSKGVFRTYFYLKQIGGKTLLNELRFEKNDSTE